MNRWKLTEIGKIPESWELKTVDEIRSPEKGSIISGPFGSNISSKYFVSNGIPVIRGNNLSLDIQEKFIDKNFVFITKEKAEELNTWAEKDDIIFTAAGTIGQLGILTGHEKYKNYIISNKQLRLRVNKEIVLPLFAYYWFSTDFCKNIILSMNTGSTIPLINLSILRSLLIPVPSLKEQHTITNIISNLSDKIDLLHRQNKTLEQLAETIFRQRFIEEADETWITGTLDDEFNITMGQSPPGNSYNENGLGNVFFQGRADFNFRFPKPRIFTTKPSRYAKKFDTLVSVRAPVGDMNMASEDCCIGRGLSAFSYKYNLSFYSYTYYKLRSLMQELQQYEDNGTVFGSITKSDFKKFFNIISPIELIQKFQLVVQPIDDKIYSNTQQITTLTRLRDKLLPLLVTGQLRVDWEAAVDEFKEPYLNPIYSIGHSNHTIEKFISLLKTHGINVVADVRSTPYSKRFPQFNREELKKYLQISNITYLFLGRELGGRPVDMSTYEDEIVDYEKVARSENFNSGIQRLLKGKEDYCIALLCAEKDPINCHRMLLVSRELVERGVPVRHILYNGEIETNKQAEERLIEVTGLSETLFDLNLPLKDRTSKAYKIHSFDVAYKKKNNG